MEDVGRQMANDLSDYIMNVDITSAQFDTDLIVEEAGKLGIDFGDLQDYGFDSKNISCGGSKCLRKQNFKDLNDWLNKTSKFTDKMKE